MLSYETLSSQFTIENDPLIGRTLVALNQSYRPGQILWTESSFLYASDDEAFSAAHQELLRHSLPSSILNSLPEIMETLASMECIQSLDTAKSFLVFLSIYILRKRDPESLASILRKIDGSSSTSSREVEFKLSLLDQLTGQNLDACLEDMRSIKSQFPALLNKSVPLLDAAKMLAILNTNQLELENGSGLFLWTAILHHDCSPNCSFTTHGSEPQLYLCCIRHITVGERLSIDYGNHFYDPTVDRIESLQQTYGFTCQCSLCTGPDRKRGFRCPNPQCSEGILFPIPSTGVDVLSPYSSYSSPCSLCGTIMTPENFRQCIIREEFYKTCKPTDTISQFKKETLLHGTHYLRFWALDAITTELTERAREEQFIGKTNNSAKLYKQAQESLKELLKLLEWQLPSIHHEKVIYYDKHAQLAVAVGDTAAAQESYKKAYLHSKLASGDIPPTRAVQDLWERTPMSLSELYARYNSNQV